MTTDIGKRKAGPLWEGEDSEGARLDDKSDCSIRATQSLMRSQRMTEGENHRDLLTRLSTALAMTEAVYLEARRRRDL